jgi:hypothetical protein
MICGLLTSFDIAKKTVNMFGQVVSAALQGTPPPVPMPALGLLMRG